MGFEGLGDLMRSRCLSQETPKPRRFSAGSSLRRGAFLGRMGAVDGSSSQAVKRLQHAAKQMRPRLELAVRNASHTHTASLTLPATWKMEGGG